MFEYTYKNIGTIGKLYEKLKEVLDNFQTDSVFKVCTFPFYSLNGDGSDRIIRVVEMIGTDKVQVLIDGVNSLREVSIDAIIYKRDFDRTSEFYESALYIADMLHTFERYNMPIITDALTGQFDEALLQYFTANNDEVRALAQKQFDLVEYEINRISLNRAEGDTRQGAAGVEIDEYPGLSLGEDPLIEEEEETEGK